MGRKDNQWKNRSGIVFSTNPDFTFDSSSDLAAETLPSAKQNLLIRLDRSGRAGKTVTLVEGFSGALSDLIALSKQLKAKCGVGGSVKDGMILIQGDVRVKVEAWLIEKGFRVKTMK